MNELYKKALKVWGRKLQINMVFEELGELIVKLSRVIRGRIKPEALAEEIADVEIMLEQLTLIFKFDDQVHDWKVKQLIRLKEKIRAFKKQKKKPLWYYNKFCPNCNKEIQNHNIQAIETGYSYCSYECALNHVNENAPEGGY